MIKQIARKFISAPTLSKVKLFVKYGPSDCIDFLFSRREPLVPPKRMIFIGGPEFTKIGDEFLKYFAHIGGLVPSSHVLDIGCGIGRMARPLTAFLSSEGRYEGFDIDGSGINWCRKHITIKYPNFHFQKSDVFNKYYNPAGVHQPANYRFPFPDDSFNFTFAISVFTHMYLSDIDHYIAESARTLKDGGTCFFTFFLVNDETASLISKKKSSIDFTQLENFWVKDKQMPEEAIAFSEERILSLFEKNGMHIDGNPRYGSWCGRDKFLSYQDIVIARKK